MFDDEPEGFSRCRHKNVNSVRNRETSQSDTASDFSFNRR